MNQYQTERFHHQMVELIKKYQFRDRSRASCCGISVTQCYIIESLNRLGPLTMKELAETMRLSVSTITRVIEPLLRKDLISRREDAHDRRIRRIDLTAEGQAVFLQNWQTVMQSEEEILKRFSPDQRGLLIDFLEQLNQAVDQWQSCCMPGCEAS